MFLVCEQGTFGQNCSQSCDCADGGSCDPVSGRCICPSGKSGARCDSGESLYFITYYSSDVRYYVTVLMMYRLQYEPLRPRLRSDM